MITHKQLIGHAEKLYKEWEKRKGLTKNTGVQYIGDSLEDRMARCLLLIVNEEKNKI